MGRFSRIGALISASKYNLSLSENNFPPKIEASKLWWEVMKALVEYFGSMIFNSGGRDIYLLVII